MRALSSREYLQAGLNKVERELVEHRNRTVSFGFPVHPSKEITFATAELAAAIATHLIGNVTEPAVEEHSPPEDVTHQAAPGAQPAEPIEPFARVRVGGREFVRTQMDISAWFEWFKDEDVEGLRTRAYRWADLCDFGPVTVDPPRLTEEEWRQVDDLLLAPIFADRDKWRQRAEKAERKLARFTPAHAVAVALEADRDKWREKARKAGRKSGKFKKQRDLAHVPEEGK